MYEYNYLSVNLFVYSFTDGFVYFFLSFIYVCHALQSNSNYSINISISAHASVSWTSGIMV